MFVKKIYPQYKRQRIGYMYNYQLLLRYGIGQKIFRINGDVPWPVDFRSKVIEWNSIEKGIMCDPGDNVGLYINATGGIRMGDNVAISANCVMVASNHNFYNHSKRSKINVGINIGNNVWIGANSTILAGANIGDNVIIGAGCVIAKTIPSNSIVSSMSRNLRVVRKKADYKWDISKEKLI